MSGFKWRKPADAMPPIAKPVLVALCGDGYDVAELWYSGAPAESRWYGQREPYTTNEIAHWTAFPEVPE